MSLTLLFINMVNVYKYLLTLLHGQCRLVHTTSLSVANNYVQSNTSHLTAYCTIKKFSY